MNDDRAYLLGGSQDGEWVQWGTLYAKFTFHETGEEYRRLEDQLGYPATFYVAEIGLTPDEMRAMLIKRGVSYLKPPTTPP